MHMLWTEVGREVCPEDRREEMTAQINALEWFTPAERPIGMMQGEGLKEAARQFRLKIARYAEGAGLSHQFTDAPLLDGQEGAYLLGIESPMIHEKTGERITVRVIFADLGDQIVPLAHGII